MIRKIKNIIWLIAGYIGIIITLFIFAIALLPIIKLIFK